MERSVKPELRDFLKMKHEITPSAIRWETQGEI